MGAPEDDVLDTVRDGCLPHPNALKVEAELILRGSGIRVVEEWSKTDHRLVIAPNGYTVLGLCVADLSLVLFRPEWLTDGTWGFVYASTSGLVVRTAT